jgi:hypothetical protein
MVKIQAIGRRLNGAERDEKALALPHIAPHTSVLIAQYSGERSLGIKSYSLTETRVGFAAWLDG